jgi:hypothetical protein
MIGTDVGEPESHYTFVVMSNHLPMGLLPQRTYLASDFFCRSPRLKLHDGCDCVVQMPQRKFGSSDFIPRGSIGSQEHRPNQLFRACGKKHVLLALSRTCSAANNLHEARKYCATELNLAYLTENGRNFIDLLKVIIPEDLSAPPSSLSYFSHPDWDTLRDLHEKSNPSDLEELVYHRMLLLRTKLIL